MDHRPEAGWRELGARMRLLRRAPVLRGLTWGQLGDLAAVARPLDTPAGSVLYREGDPAGRFYVVERGRLLGRVSWSDEVWELGPGTSVGDAALAGEASYRATVSVGEPSRLWALDRHEIEGLSRADPHLAVALEAARPGAGGGPEAVTDRELTGYRVEAIGLTREVGDGRRILNGVSLAIEPGEMVAILGGSGAGKSTLLDALSGVHPADDGVVLFDGADLYGNLAAARTSLGYVPQEDIIHRELPLELTLRYAARLRLPADAPAAEIDEAVHEAMQVLDLSERAAVRVGSLSGGQRKRASIGVELLTRPRVFFLDEPTSGLDPATESEMMRQLRRLADAGSTIVLSTHVTENVGLCDRVVFLAGDGHLAFFGAPADAPEHFLVDAIGEIYERVAEEGTPEEWGDRFRSRSEEGGTGVERPAAGEPAGGPAEGPASSPMAAPRPAAGPFRQWSVLTRRNVDILRRNPLTLGILLGSPILIVLMFVVLFRPGAFDPADPSPSATIMIVFWVSFGGFFFGLTYGLLQVVTEFPILRREAMANVRIGSYLASKLTVLLPFLLVVAVALLGILRLFDRLPAAGWSTYASLALTVLLIEGAALTTGLAASAFTTEPAQASLALPLITFPQVLFSGGILAVPIMALLGRVMSYGMAVRWGFEALGSTLQVNRLYAEGASPLGPPLLAQYGDTFSRPAWEAWLVLAGFAVAFLLLAYGILRRRLRVPARRA
ncbi:MAG: ATP-binding cassette domain-containing protein [Actinobacteria bacterium]|nr:ATP-binding cassette domain-containing protein [Actinomycetota bacterium]